MFSWFLCCLLSFGFSAHALELRWDWSTINPTQVHFSSDFLWGAAVSEYQVSGAHHCDHSNWALWESKAAHQSGKACDHWATMDETIEALKKIGVKAFRFSVEWSMLEPHEGDWRDDVLQKYYDFLQKLNNAGIKAFVTLHHFTHPEWFERKKAFEKAENNRYFVNFAKKVIKKLHPLVHKWCTINEPGIYVFQGYVRGVFPPGKTNLFLAGTVLENLLKAHVQLYLEIKKLEIGKHVELGIVHNILQFDAYHDNIIEKALCDRLNAIINDAVIGFFEKGVFEWRALPGMGYKKHSYPAAQHTLDFIGLNYYAHVLINWKHPSRESYRKDDIKTDMPYALYAEGLYRAIQTISVLKVPIYITENGIADAQDDRRELWIQRYTYALHKAIQDGYDVRGFFYWSLMDNFEWDEGYRMRFGLYEVDFQTGKKTLRQGSHYFVNLVAQTYKKSLFSWW